MAWQIIKQPDGKFCVYSTVVDHFVYTDLSESQVTEVYKDEWGRNGVDFAERVIESLANGGQPYSQFTQSFDEAVAWIKKLHGKLELCCTDGTVITEEHFYNIGEKNEPQ